MRSNREAMQALRSYSLDNVNQEDFNEPTRAACVQTAKRCRHLAPGLGPGFTTPTNPVAPKERRQLSTEETTMAGTFTSLHYHLIFSTKNRAPLIKERHRERLYEYIGGVIRSECKVLQSGKRTGGLIAIGGMPDHLHVLVRWPQNRTVSNLMRIVKSRSSRWMSDLPDAGSFSWQEGYGAFSVSQSGIADVDSYIRNQADHHATRSC